MNTRRLVVVMRSLWLGVGAAAILAAGCAGLSTHKLTMLTGAQEVPPVTTNGSGRADISVEPFKCPSAASSNNCPTVLGTVTTSGMTGTVAEIHQGAPVPEWARDRLFDQDGRPHVVDTDRHDADRRTEGRLLGRTALRHGGDRCPQGRGDPGSVEAVESDLGYVS